MQLRKSTSVHTPPHFKCLVYEKLSWDRERTIHEALAAQSYFYATAECSSIHFCVHGMSKMRLMTETDRSGITSKNTKNKASPRSISLMRRECKHELEKRHPCNCPATTLIWKAQCTSFRQPLHKTFCD